ncbi:MAG: hypothetical protein AVDCRST_MAG73-4142, partial [uncultured Thermomicrobiales bacterium]
GPARDLPARPRHPPTWDVPNGGSPSRGATPDRGRRRLRRRRVRGRRPNPAAQRPTQFLRLPFPRCWPDRRGGVHRPGRPGRWDRALHRVRQRRPGFPDRTRRDGRRIFLGYHPDLHQSGWWGGLCGSGVVLRRYRRRGGRRKSSGCPGGGGGRRRVDRRRPRDHDRRTVPVRRRVAPVWPTGRLLLGHGPGGDPGRRRQRGGHGFRRDRGRGDRGSWGGCPGHTGAGRRLRRGPVPGTRPWL